MVEGTLTRVKRVSAKKAVFKDTSESESDEEFQEVVKETKPKKSKTTLRKANEVNNVVDKVLEDGRLKMLFDNPVQQDEPEGLVIEFNKYWPHGLNSDEPIDKNLVLFEVAGGCGKPSCPLCGQSPEKYVRLQRLIKLSHTAYERSHYCHNHLFTLEKVTTPEAMERDSEEFRLEIKAKLKLMKKNKEETEDDGKKDICISEKSYFVPIGGAIITDICKPITTFDIAFYDIAFQVVCYQSRVFFFLNTSICNWSHFRLQFSKLGSNLFKSYFLDNRLRNGHISPPVSLCEGLSDTSDYTEATMPDGFTLKLRDYQLRSLSWMKALESSDFSERNSILNNYHEASKAGQVKIKIGESGWFIDIFGYALTNNQFTRCTDPLVIRGGVLADDTGSGKTITCLALIHSSPFTEKEARERNSAIRGFPYNIPSRASCIVCPSNLFLQWINEATRCNPQFKIVGISCIRDYQKYSWKDLILADLVIISYQFLTNSNYLSLKKNFDFDLHKVLDKIDEKGCIVLSEIWFHRLIFDEIHEMGHKSNKCKSMAVSLKADSHWGITGTPKFDEPADVTALFPYLNIDAVHEERLVKSPIALAEFLSKFVKRNVPDLQLPPLVHETVWVTATADELSLMNYMSRNDCMAQRIMMCSHYQISQGVSEVVGGEFLTKVEVKEKLEKAKLLDMKMKESSMLIATEKLEQFKNNGPEKNASDEEKKNYKKKFDALVSEFKHCSDSFIAAKGEYNFFINVFKTLEPPQDGTTGPEENSCRICYDTIPASHLSMLPCSHLYCYECLLSALKVSPKCPACRAEVKDTSSIIRLKPLESSETCLKEKGLDTSKYGSKLIALYNYLTDLLENDPNARIILFLQYAVLANFISTTLDQLAINHVRVSGNVFKRQDAINQFTTSKDVRLIMLSSEDSVSGMNLTQATHIIMLHPFFTGQGDNVDIAWEKQGICRAYRSGLDHPLKVVRFAVKGTVEEELTLNRQGKY